MRRYLTSVVTVVAALGLVAGVSSCGSSDRSARTPPTTAGPALTAPPSTVSPAGSTTQPPASVLDVRIYLLHGDKLGVAHRTVAATTRVATAAMSELLSGPNADDQAAGMSTAVPTGTRLLGINIASGVATVDLKGGFASGGGSLSMSGRLAQVTYTLTQFPSATSVLFRLDGKPVTVFGGEGIVLDHPVTRATFESLAPAILLESPGRGWAVTPPLRIAGSANVFEAQFRAEITDITGKVIADQAVQATSGTGTRGTFDTTIAFPSSAGGPATLTVFDLSAKDGSRIDVVTVPLELSGS